MSLISRLGSAVSIVGGVLVALPLVYLLALLAAAGRARRERSPRESTSLRFLVLIPAHDEEAGIAGTLRSVAAVEYPASRCRIVVIADNCTDRTADVARRAGVEVLERKDERRRGKGHALAWALARLNPAAEADAVVVVDADCVASPNLLSALGARLGAGAEAAQVDYVVANPGDASAAALRFAAFTLMTTVRARGKDALGLSTGLFGTGMGFTTSLLERVPWRAFGLIEDFEYHLQLVASGVVVRFAREAAVRSAMPLTLLASADQQLRWEGGKWRLVKTWTPRLVIEGFRLRDPVRLNAGLELLVPPQTLLALANLSVAVFAVGSKSRLGRRLAVFNVSSHVLFVLGGLRLARVNRSVYYALALAPALVLQKVGLYLLLSRRGAPSQWTRTQRT